MNLFYLYLFNYSEQDFACGIHDMGPLNALLFVVVDSVHDSAAGVEHGAAVAAEDERLHPESEDFLLR